MQLSFVPTYLQCLAHLTDGKGDILAPEVSRAAQDAMATGLRHHSSGLSPDKHEAVLNFIQVGLRERNRSIRMAAGYAISDLP